MSFGEASGRPESPRPWLNLLVLVLLSFWYFAATVPHLDDYPLLDWAQMGIVAPAYKLAAEGVYGNDLFAGYHRTELRNYEFMPAYPLLVAASMKIFGLGVWQVRGVSVLCGWLAMLLTFQLGRQLYGTVCGLLAATLLVTLRPGLIPGTSGVAVLDFARIIRYDILVPVLVLGACCCFVSAVRRPGGSGVALLCAGLLAGLATLAHVYGAFVLAVFAAVLLWQRGWRGLRSPAPTVIAAGWVVGGWMIALLPWIVYVLQDFDAYVGQMSRHQGRFDLFDPSFFWHNLLREPWRYAAWSGGSLETALLSPRVGIWLILILLPVSSFWLWRRASGPNVRLSDRFLLLAFPILQLLLALLIALKRYYYTSLVVPFIALQLAFLATMFDAWARRRGSRWRIVLPVVLVLTFLEAGVGVARRHAQASRATPYLELSEAVAGSIPRGSRLLISQPYWLGLERFGHHAPLSVNMLFSFPGVPMEGIMERLDPDYVVIERYFLEVYPADPRGGGENLRTRKVFLAFGAYLDEHCSKAAEHPNVDYGTIEVYDCTSRSATSPPA